MSTPDTLVAVATAVSQAVSSKGPTTGDLIAQMGLFQFAMIIAAFGAVAALVYLAIALHRIADTLASGSFAGSTVKTSIATPVFSPAAVTPASIHPGLSDEKLAVLLAVAAAEVMGSHVNVVKFRSADNKDWTWAHQGRVDLHTRRL